jgi:DNA topoisomerase-1
VDLAAGAGNTFRTNGSTLVKPGFLAVYRESVDDAALNPDDDENRVLPPLATGDKIKLLSIDPEQHFTEPPPRYSEASLVKALEEYGIGRPSTYASIIQTLLYKKYCELLNKRFVPTDLGKIVNRFLTGNFERYVDFGFTASMEDELDNISRGEEEWVPALDRFWQAFKQQIDDVEANVTRSDVAMERPLGIDPVSGRPVSVRYGRFGAFAQIGTREDEEKPKFASLRPHQRMDDLTLEQALDLFQLPRTVGNWEDGHPIKVAIGRFGPYVQHEKTYASLEPGDEVFTIGLNRAVTLIAEKVAKGPGRGRFKADPGKILGDHPNGGPIAVKNGRYGPYVTHDGTNATLPADLTPETVTLAQAIELIDARAGKGKPKRGKKAATAKSATPDAATEATPAKKTAKVVGLKTAAKTATKSAKKSTAKARGTVTAKAAPAAADKPAAKKTATKR